MDLSLIDQIGSTQIGVVTRRQLQGLGFSREQIRHLIRIGLLIRIHPGVYRLAGTPRSRHQDVLAAALAAGEDAVVSHETAAATHGIIPATRLPRIELTVPMLTSARVGGVLLHRTRSLEKVDLVVVDSIPVTSVPRTLIDLARSSREPRLKYLLDRALILRITTVGEVFAALDRLSGGRHGMARLQRVVEARAAEPEDMESTGQQKAYRILVDNGFPAPLVEFNIFDENDVFVARADLALDVVTLDIEYDGRGPHFNEAAAEADRRRDLRVFAAGWLPLRITAADLRDPRDFLRAVAARFAEKGVPLPNVTSWWRV